MENNYINKKYGKLTIKEIFKKPQGAKQKIATYVSALCDCGNTKTIYLYHILSGGTQSCGCHRYEVLNRNKTKHGYRKREQREYLYDLWLNIKNRCRPNGPKPQYRNIKFFAAWAKDFSAFKNYLIDNLGERPSKKHSLDRYPILEGDYVPENVRWADKNEQANNRKQRSPNREIYYKGVLTTINQLSRMSGINYQTIASRIDRGWSIEQAIETPINKNALIP